MGDRKKLLMDVGIVCDFIEERWYSMDIVADMLMGSLPHIHGMNPRRLIPSMKFRFSRPPLLRRYQPAANLDRVINRLHEYPRYLKGQRGLDVYHIVDHSYAHLVHVLPADRVVVTCHDVDTFRCLFSPDQEPRSYLFKRMAKHILSGLQKASRVACDSFATRDALLRGGGLPAERLEVVPLGIDPVFASLPDPHADLEACQLLGEPDPERLEVLHVGSAAPRKRIDVLLHIFAAIRKQLPSARLVRVGGAFTPSQQSLVQRLELGEAVTVFPHLRPRTLAAFYRRAAVALLPSDREGFGLPVAEAMACGACVIVSDLPVLRETGGDAAVYCEPGNPLNWVPAAIGLLREKAQQGDAWRHRVAKNLKQASRFTSAEYARRMAELYSAL
jgi:glycosyltransferase involved in cell wall biosynthesis